jgi:hypothetical protein
MSRVFLATVACMVSTLMSVEADATTFKKSQVAKSGKASCAVHKGKWQPVKKKGSSYSLISKAKSSEKTACKALLVPSKATSLDDLPDVGAITKSNSKASATLTSLGVAGSPPLLKDIATLGAENVFWRTNVVNDIATGTPPNPASCQEFFGGTDGQSSAFFGCNMAQGVAEVFGKMMSSQTLICITDKIPTEANLSSGGIAVVAGSLPGGKITKLFETPSGKTARIVKIKGPQGQDVLIRVAGSDTNLSKSNQYAFDAFICQNSSVIGYNAVVVTLGGTFKSTVQHPFGFGQSVAGRMLFQITSALKKGSGGSLEFDSTSDRTAEFIGVDANTSLASQITITGANVIKSRLRRQTTTENSKTYAESKFQGSDALTLQFLEGAAKGEFSHSQAGSRSFSGATEYRDTVYASAPSNSFATSVNSLDFTADQFYTKTLSVPELPSFDCSTGADVTLAFNFAAPSMQAVAQQCASTIQNPNFCFTQTIVGAQARYPSVCQ